MYMLYTSNVQSSVFFLPPSPVDAVSLFTWVTDPICFPTTLQTIKTATVSENTHGSYEYTMYTQYYYINTKYIILYTYAYNIIFVVTVEWIRAYVYVLARRGWRFVHDTFCVCVVSFFFHSLLKMVFADNSIDITCIILYRTIYTHIYALFGDVSVYCIEVQSFNFHLAF